MSSADRTSTRLEFSQEVAEGTLNRSAEVLQTISPISQKVQEWSNNLNNNEYSTEAFDRAVVSAGEAGNPTHPDLNILHQRRALVFTEAESV